MSSANAQPLDDNAFGSDALDPDLDPEPRPEEMPGGPIFLEFLGEAEAIGGRHWTNATADERARMATGAAVTARRSLAQARRAGYSSVTAYLAATAEPPELVSIASRRVDPDLLAAIARGDDPRTAQKLARQFAELDAEERDIEAMEDEADRRTVREFHVRTWADLMAEPDDPPPVIRPGVPETGVIVLAGPPKAGKTIWAGQLAIESKRSTLLIEEEGSMAGLSYRLRTQAAALGVTDPPVSLMHRQRIRLDDPSFVGRLRRLIEVGGYQLVIVDPLNRTHSADENRPTEMTRVMDGLAEIAYGLGIAVVAIHHLAKPSAERRGDPWDRFRGASSIRSGTDANLILDATGDRMHLIGEFRDAEPLSEWLELDHASLIFRPAEAPEAPTKVDPIALREFVESRGQVVGRQVVEQFGVSRNTAFAALRALGCDEYSGPRNVLTFSLRTGQ